jgi:peptidoglycan/xylan/chitin deacetylase (PgdA/CDA1 family)
MAAMHVHRPAGLRERLAALLDRTGALAAAVRLRRSAPVSTVSIVTFHRIAEADDGEPYDPDVVDATPAQLRRHVETLARIGTPIGMDTLLRALDGGGLPPSPVMITFDDGYRSCREIALPILRRLGVPATFFIATAFPGGGKLYWWERIAAVLHLARGRTGDLAYPHPLRIDASDPRARRLLDDTVKNTPGLDLDRFLDGLCAALEVPWSAALEARLAAPLIMTWDDARALARAGMDVESHTRSHRVLETLDDDELREELVGSRRELELQLGRQVRAIAYPVGRCQPNRVRRAVAEAGYRIGLTNGSGVNRVWPAPLCALDRFDIRRLSTERSQSDAMFLTQIAIPPLGFA